MSSLIDKYLEELHRDKPIVYNGLSFHPLIVEDYVLYISAKPAFELMLASLPPAIARLSWFEALDELDREASRNGQETAFAGMALLVLGKALRLAPFRDPNNPERSYYPVRMMRNQQGRVAAVMVGDQHNPTILNMQAMRDIREIIAAQNCYEIPNENWNPELVRAQQFLNRKKMDGIVFDLDALVHSVAINAHAKASEVWDWTVKEFQAVQDAIDRTLHYQIFTSAEMTGFVKFKKGNPFPTWRFDKRADLPGEFTTVDELDKGANGLLGEPGIKTI